MSYYQDNLLPRIQNRIMDNKTMRERRRQVCQAPVTEPAALIAALG